MNWTLPHGTGVISLVPRRSVEDHQTSAVHQHSHLPLLCPWQPGQDHRLADVMDPDQVGATLIILVARIFQGHHLTCLNMYILGSLRTHTWKRKVIWFYISDLDTKTLKQINNSDLWILILLDSSSVISICVNLLRYMLFPGFQVTEWYCLVVLVSKETCDAKKGIKTVEIMEKVHNVTAANI